MNLKNILLAQKLLHNVEPDTEGGAAATEEVAAEETVEETAETTTEETPEEVSEETDETETPGETETPEEIPPVVFDAADELPVVTEKATQILEKYELPEEVQGVIEAYRARAEANNTQFADYGDAESVREALERDSLLQSFERTDSGLRPNTDKYVQQIREQNPETVDWMYFDMSVLPSAKYPGLTKFQESLCDVFGKDGEPIGTVLKRYEQAQAFIAGQIPETDIPKFITEANLQKAYQSLSRETREEIMNLSPEYDEDGFDNASARTRKLDELAKIQRGIEADEARALAETQAKQSEAQALQQEVVTTQETFYSEMEKTFFDKLKDIKFSEDPKVQLLQATRSVTLLRTAFYEDATGASARAALKEAGIDFDYVQARSLVKEVEDASVALVEAKRIKDASGNPVNKVAVSKAAAKFTDAGRKWHAFAEGLLEQEARLTSGATEEAVKKEVAKIKVAPKARPTANGKPTPAAKKEIEPQYGTPEWDKYWADKTIQEQAQRAAPYQVS